jgi:hypothetical protein
MEDAELRSKFEALEKKMDATYASAEKSRKYVLGMLIATLAAFVLPIVGLLFAIPQFMSVYGSISNLGI